MMKEKKRVAEAHGCWLAFDLLPCEETRIRQSKKRQASEPSSGNGRRGSGCEKVVINRGGVLSKLILL